MQFPLGAMTAGDILDRSLKMLFARLPTLYAINLIVVSPLILLTLSPFFFVGDFISEDTDSTAWKMMFVFFIYPVLAGVLQPVATGAILYIVLEQIDGRRATVANAFSFAFSRFGTLIGQSLSVGLLFGIGRLFCCIPGMVIQAFYLFGTHAVLFEKMRVGESLQRSYSLGSRYFLNVFMVILIIVLADSAVFCSLLYGVPELLPVSDDIPSAGGRFSRLNVQNLLVVVSLIILADTLFRAYFAVCTTVLYFDLRFRNEGFDLEMAAGQDDEKTASYGPGIRNKTPKFVD
jgi:hypothetical protein